MNKQSISFYPICSIKKQEPFLFVLQIAGTKIMMTQGFPLRNLQHLSINFNTVKRVCGLSCEKNPYIHQFPGLYMNNTVRFDLQLLQHIDFRDITLFLVCSSRDLLLLNYLVRIKTFAPKIVCTTAASILGAPLIQELYRLADIRNRRFYDSIKEDYHLEQEAFQLFEDRYNNNFQEFTEALPLQPLKIQQMNYGQIIKLPLLELDSFLEIQAHPDGRSIGGASYSLKLGDYFSILVSTDISFTPNISRPLPQPFPLAPDYLILGFQRPELGCPTNYIIDHLQQGKNIVLPFMDYEFILNLQDDLNDRVAPKCHKIFVISSEFSNFMNLANSLVEFLNHNLQNNVMQEPPLNPFAKMLSLVKTQKLIIANSIEDIKFEHTLQSTIRTVTPSVYFIFDTSFRLGQHLFLFDLLESVAHQGHSIYTMRSPDLSFSFILLLTDSEFQGPELLEQIKDLYKFKLVVVEAQKQINDGFIGRMGMKSILSPDVRILANHTQYQMLQKINLNLAQLDLNIPIRELGEGRRTLYDVKISKSDLKIIEEDRRYVGVLQKQGHSLLVKFGAEDLRDKQGELDKLIQKAILGLNKIRDQRGLLVYEHQYSNKIRLAIKLEENKVEIFGQSNPDIQKAYDIVYDNLNLQRF